MFSYAPRQPVLQNSWKDSLESTCATMVPFMFVMSLRTDTQRLTLDTALVQFSTWQHVGDSLFTHGAALLGGGFV